MDTKPPYVLSRVDHTSLARMYLRRVICMHSCVRKRYALGPVALFNRNLMM